MDACPGLGGRCRGWGDAPIGSRSAPPDEPTAAQREEDCDEGHHASRRCRERPALGTGHRGSLRCGLVTGDRDEERQTSFSRPDSPPGWGLAARGRRNSCPTRRARGSRRSSRPANCVSDFRPPREQEGERCDTGGAKVQSSKADAQRSRGCGSRATTGSTVGPCRSPDWVTTASIGRASVGNWCITPLLLTPACRAGLFRGIACRPSRAAICIAISRSRWQVLRGGFCGQAFA